VSLYFFDTSALVKRYTIETGTSWVVSVVKSSRKNRIIIAEITQLEVVSALVRKYQKSNISSTDLQVSLSLLERHVVRQYTLINYGVEVQREAQNIILNYPLRTLDSIQMASAYVMGQQLQAKQLPLPIFVSADQKLLDVAKQLGFSVENPNLYP
jgi:uncharacterized protein